jgi:D-glycero-D-manno-heptose 1,7-bisphosphate phosphatase
MTKANNINQPAIFLDRDGVINYDHEYTYQIKDFIFIEGVFDVCKYFIQLGYQLVIITNQSGIARGYYSEEDFETLNQWMLEQFKIHKIEIKGVYFCPHHPIKGIGKYKIDCDCRKPKPGMILQAALEHQIDLSQSILIGDNLSDIKAGRSAGIGRNILVKTGKKEVIDDDKLADSSVENLSSLKSYI